MGADGGTSGFDDSAMPRFGLGCAPIGNLFRAYSEDDADALLAAAWDAGVRHFDTAPHYGLGLSEQRLGRLLRSKPREEFVVSTKVGRLIRPNPDWDGASLDDANFHVSGRLHRVLDYSVEGVRQSIEESLARLGLDRIDIAYVHDPERSGNPAAIEDGLTGLAALRGEGLVGEIGIGSMSVAAHVSAIRTGLAQVNMVANRYTLLEQSVSPNVLAACDRYGTRIVAAAVFNSGVLSGAPRAGAKYDYADVPAEVLSRTVQIDAVCRAHGVELPTAALHYPLLDARVVAVVVGAASPEHVVQNLRRLATAVPQALWDELDDRKLVPRCA